MLSVPHFLAAAVIAPSHHGELRDVQMVLHLSSAYKRSRGSLHLAPIDLQLTSQGLPLMLQ